MSRERDTAHRVMKQVGGLTIIRSEARNYDKWSQEFSGKTKVYYDVCDEDGDLLESFKTMREAERFCR